MYCFDIIDDEWFVLFWMHVDLEGPNTRHNFIFAIKRGYKSFDKDFVIGSTIEDPYVSELANNCFLANIGMEKYTVDMNDNRVFDYYGRSTIKRRDLPYDCLPRVCQNRSHRLEKLEKEIQELKIQLERVQDTTEDKIELLAHHADSKNG